MFRVPTALVLIVASLAPVLARAGDADVLAVTATRRMPGLYDLAVTIRSRDTGWDRYADRIEVLAADGRIVATRVLDHPHETEQPFTRDVPGVPALDPTTLTVRAHFRPTGFDGDTRVIALPPR